jgi:hypothetical protein
MRPVNRFRKPYSRGIWARVALVVVCGFALAVFLNTSTARAADEATLQVVVKEAASGDPIFQAHLTLQFRIPQKYRLDKWISYSAKTDKKGECTFRHITKGAIRLMVTADGYQTFGKEFEIKKDNPVIEIKLRKPQPQI